MINKVSIRSIEFYQKNLSQHKGYICAYRYYTGKDSCSEYTKKCIAKYGILKSIPLFLQQIKLCKKIYIEKKDLNQQDGYEKFCNSCATISPCL